MAYDSVFSPFTQRGVTFSNRLVMSPMCQYSALDGIPSLWHWTHLSSRAVGGVGLIIVESTGVSPTGRITPWDVGLWNDAQEKAFKDIVRGLHALGSRVGVQLSHAGRKATTDVPWRGGGYLDEENGGWAFGAPSPLGYTETSPIPFQLNRSQIQEIVDDFVESARRAARAEFDVVELHAAHGYLIHQFLSPIANHRNDDYGGEFSGRVRFMMEIVEGVRAVWPEQRPLWVRLPVTDWISGGWSTEEAIKAGILLKQAGVDLIDTSSGRIHAKARPLEGPVYHGPYARQIREAAKVSTGVVGRIETADQAAFVLDENMGDMVIIGRALLRDPYLPLRWDGVDWPVQYLRALAHPRNGRDLQKQWSLRMKTTNVEPQGR